MDRRAVFAAAAIVAVQALAPFAALAGETYYYRRGYGVKDANVFAPKYDKRLQNWLEQINLGRTKGFLTEEQAQHFIAEHAKLAQVFVDVDKAGYPKDQLDAMEAKFNAFNVELSDAMNGKPKDTSTAPAPQVVPDTSVIPKPAQAAKPATTAISAKKPAAAPRPSIGVPSRTDHRTVQKKVQRKSQL